MKFIIEHLEPRLYKWCALEYEHISSIVGKGNLIFTNVKTDYQIKTLSLLGTAYKDNIGMLVATKLKGLRLALLDANATKTLTPNDGFDGLIFGGILGDDPPRGRTLEELGSLGLPLRNLGTKQMPTDSAVYAAKKIISGTPFESLDFMDGIELEMGKMDSVILPFRYVLVNGKPLVSKKLWDYMRRRKGF